MAIYGRWSCHAIPKQFAGANHWRRPCTGDYTRAGLAGGARAVLNHWKMLEDVEIEIAYDSLIHSAIPRDQWIEPLSENKTTHSCPFLRISACVNPDSSFPMRTTRKAFTDDMPHVATHCHTSLKWSQRWQRLQRRPRNQWKRKRSPWRPKGSEGIRRDDLHRGWGWAMRCNAKKASTSFYFFLLILIIFNLDGRS